MALQTPVSNVTTSDNFEQWWEKTNQTITMSNTQETNIGDIDTLADGTSTNLVDAVNATRNFSIAISIALG